MAQPKTRGQIPQRGKTESEVNQAKAKAKPQPDEPRHAHNADARSAVLGNPPQQRQRFNPNVNSAKGRFQHQNRG